MKSCRQISFFAEKNMRKKLIFLLPLLAACDRISVSGDEYPEPKQPSAVYSVAVEYPEDYNWRVDSLGGKVPTSIVCYADSIEFLRLNTLESGILGVDADMHRIVQGHLYSDFSTTTDETVISRDGKELFRYRGREMICGFQVRDTSVFALCCPRNGEGWTYRHNGKAIISSENGTLQSGLYEDRGQLCFSYTEPIVAGRQHVGRHYFVSDGKDSLLMIPADVSSVLAIRRFDGRINYLATLRYMKGLVWQQGSKAVVADRSTESASTGECGFVVAENSLLATARMDDVTYFWDRDNTEYSTMPHFTADAVCDNKPYLCYASSYYGMGRSLTVHYKHRDFTIPYRYRLTSSNAFTCDRNEFAIGLNDCDDNYRPLIIHGRDTMRFGFNGYFIGLSLP